MKLVPENIDEAIKHLTPRSMKEIEPFLPELKKEIYNWIKGHLYGDIIDEQMIYLLAQHFSITEDVVKEVINTFPKGTYKLTKSIHT